MINVTVDGPIEFNLKGNVTFTLNDQVISFSINSVGQLVLNLRLLEDGDTRILENGDYRLLED